MRRSRDGGTAVRMSLAVEAGPGQSINYGDLTPYDLPYRHFWITRAKQAF
jgi:hypothetical protein